MNYEIAWEEAIDVLVDKFLVDNGCVFDDGFVGNHEMCEGVLFAVAKTVEQKKLDYDGKRVG